MPAVIEDEGLNIPIGFGDMLAEGYALINSNMNRENGDFYSLKGTLYVVTH